jgi:hypothetical protein
MMPHPKRLHAFRRTPDERWPDATARGDRRAFDPGGGTATAGSAAGCSSAGREDAMRHIRSLLIILLIGLTARAALAQSATADASSNDQAAIRALIERWYAEQRAGPDGRLHALLAPGAIDASPAYQYPRRTDGPRAAVLGPPVYSSLAYIALMFRHEIHRLVADARFARVGVRERGYFYAAAVQRTYERMGSATFVLEKQEDGRWLVLAHRTDSVGFPPSLATVPLPALRDLYYSTVGRDRDPDADARAARNH